MGNGGLDSAAAFNASVGERYVLPKSERSELTTISCQTAWQHSLVMAAAKRGQIDFCTDVTYSPCRDYYVHTTCIFDDVIQKNVAVLTTLQYGMGADQNGYHPHFYVLVKIHFAVWGFGEQTCRVRVIMVDFSDAQQKSIMWAFGMVEIETLGQHLNVHGLPTDEFVLALDLRAVEGGRVLFENGMVKLVGCYFHWKQSLEKTMKNSKFVKADEQRKLHGMVEQCRTAQTPRDFEKCARAARLAFPEAEDWFNWWFNPIHGSLIHESMKPKNDDPDGAAESASGLRKPRTNNASEANNRDQKRCAPTQNASLGEAITSAYWYTIHHRNEHEAALRGAPIKKRRPAVGASAGSGSGGGGGAETTTAKRRREEEEREHFLGKAPDSNKNSAGANLKLCRKHNEAPLQKGDRVRCAASLFGAKFARQCKSKTLDGTIVSRHAGEVYTVRWDDDGKTLKSSAKHLRRITK